MGDVHLVQYHQHNKALANLDQNKKETVVNAFKEKGLSEEIALQNARLAKILTVDDYDFNTRTPILWTASPGYRIDDGAGSKDEKVD